MMEWKIGAVYHGFRLEKEEAAADIQSAAKIFVHEKSGAKLLVLANQDDNKVFSVTFRTPPADSTGVAHIVEHSVLCGSRQFPLKEPFVELVKGSLNTFLNAMTFPDKTMYPIASRNAKDFRNLMNVYLDAVFYPNMYNTPETLMQEGWHYELADVASELVYKGVVYNEMKGVFSSPDAVLEHNVLSSLFPDTTYGFESGGDPEFITDLTQSMFLDFHRRYYHPANSYIFLYGDMDILAELEFIDTQYLCNFDKITVDSTIARQAPFAAPQEAVFYYPVADGEDITDKSFMSLNMVVGNNCEAELPLAFEMLTYLLLETPAAPLKQALLAAGIGKDISGSFERSLLQPVFGITVSGTNAVAKERFVQTVEQELTRLVTQGIDKKVIEAAINRYEFAFREANFGSRPKGLMYNIKCLESWLYDADPLLHLNYSAALANIKTALTTDYFEQLIQTYLLGNSHRSLVTLVPQPGLAARKEQENREKLAAYKATLSSRELEQIVAETKRLQELQQAVDSPEALATIPLLSLSDITREVEALPQEVRQEQGVPVCLQDLPTNGIAYVKLYFDAMSIPQTHLPYVHMLVDLLGKVDAGDYRYADLANEVNIHTGGISYSLNVYSQHDDDQIFAPQFVIKSKALVEKLPQLAELLAVIAADSRFADRQRLWELVKEMKAKWDNGLFRRGQEVAAARALSYLSPSAHYNETGLLTFYDFITDLEKNYDERAEELAQALAWTAAQLFAKPNVTLSVTVDRAHYPAFQQAFGSWAGRLPAATATREAYTATLSAKNEAIMTPGKVQYVVQAANFRRLGYAYHGSYKVLETILRYDYLWTKIRVQGGAYGAFASFERNGNLLFGSYRDPNLAETLAVYRDMAGYLRSFAADEREMTKYIIGTISRMDTPLTASQKGELADSCYFRGLTTAERQRERDEVLETTLADIQRAAEVAAAATAQNYICVLGGEEKIKANSQLFGSLLRRG